MDEGWGEIHLRLEYADEAKVSQFSATIFLSQFRVKDVMCVVCRRKRAIGTRNGCCLGRMVHQRKGDG